MTKILIDEATVKLALEALEADYLAMVADGNGHMVYLEDQAITALREALAEQPAQQPAQQALDKKAENARELGLDYEPAQHTEQPLEMVGAYCKAWEQSFLADNPYHTVQITAADRKHIEAGLKAMLADQPAQRKPLTGKQIRALWEQEAKPERSTACFFTAFARAIEAAHGIKENT